MLIVKIWYVEKKFPTETVQSSKIIINLEVIVKISSVSPLSKVWQRTNPASSTFDSVMRTNEVSHELRGHKQTNIKNADFALVVAAPTIAFGTIVPLFRKGISFGLGPSPCCFHFLRQRALWREHIRSCLTELDTEWIFGQLHISVFYSFRIPA